MTGTIEIVGTGGIIEGNLGAANVNVNLDSALYFSGGDGSPDSEKNVVTMGDVDLITTGSMTLSAWIKPEATSDTVQGATIIGKQVNYNATVLGYGLYWRHANNNIYFNLGDGSNGVRLSYDASALVDTWIHIAGIYNSSTKAMVLYVNGVSVDTGTATGVGDLSASNSNILRLGGNGSEAANGAAYFKGYIADARIYTAIKDQSFVQKLAAKINVDDPNNDSNANMVGWWKCNDGSGSTIVDHHNVGTDFNGVYKRNNSAYSTDIWKFDEYSVDVYDNSTTTDGTFTVTQGKVEGKALTSLDFDGTNDRVDIGDLGDYTAISMAVWVKPHDATPSNQGIVGFDGNKNGIDTGSGSNVLRIKHERVNSSFTDTTYTWLQNQWQQVGFSWDGSTLNVYADGVQINSVSLSGNPWKTTGADIGALVDGIWPFDGNIRDVRLYDYGLSEEQMASLYSGTYPQTPKHHYKLDDSIRGTETTTAVDSGTGTAVNGTLSGFYRYTGLASDSSSNWINGTLDLDGTLTIAANGTLSAPRGNMTLAGVTSNVTMDNYGVFTHNSGTVTLDHSADVTQMINKNGTVEPVFFNLTHNRPANSYHMFLKNNVTVENTFTNTAGFMNVAANKTLTLGTDTSQATYTTGWSGGGIRPAGTSTGNPAHVHGKNVLFPAIMASGSGDPIDWNNEAPDTEINIKFIDYQRDTSTGGSGTKVTLDGDCEFDAFTVSSGDTLDCEHTILQHQEH